MKPIRIGPVKLDDPVILAPMSGGDRSALSPLGEALRRRAGGLGNDRQRGDDPRQPQDHEDGVEVRGRAADRGPARRLRPGDGRPSRPDERGPRRRHHRHQHGLPGEKGDERTTRRIGAHARFGARGKDPRGRGPRGQLARHLEDAHGLGRRIAQCARARAYCRIMRDQDDLGARADAMPILPGPRRLVVHSQGKAGGPDPGDRQRRRVRAGGRAGNARGLGGRRGDDRTGDMRPAVAAQPSDPGLEDGPHARPAAARRPARARARAFRIHADPPRNRSRHAHRP